MIRREQYARIEWEILHHHRAWSVSHPAPAPAPAPNPQTDEI